MTRMHANAAALTFIEWAVLHCVFVLRMKKPTPFIQGMDKAIKSIEERLKKLENQMKPSKEENNENKERRTRVSLKNDCEER